MFQPVQNRSTHIDMAIDAPETSNMDVSPAGQSYEAFPNLSRHLAIRGANSQQALALKERSLADREYIAGQSFDLRSQKLELEKIKTLSDMEKERMQVMDTVEMHRQTMRATAGIAKLSGDEPDYQQRMLSIMAANPLAAKDPIITKAIGFRDEHAMMKERFQGQLDQFKAEEAARQADALAREKNQQENKEKMAKINNDFESGRMVAKDLDEARLHFATTAANVAMAKSAMDQETDPEKKKVLAGNVASFQAAQDALTSQFPALKNPPADASASTAPAAPTPPTSFKTEEEAQAAAAAGTIKHGDKIIVGGTNGVWQE